MLYTSKHVKSVPAEMFSHVCIRGNSIPGQILPQTLEFLHMYSESLIFVLLLSFYDS